jgi:hypothetical protein
MSEVDVVEVELEDLVFGQADVEHDREHDLGDLAAPGALVGEEVLFDDLLRDGAAALGDAAGADVGHERAGHADGIDAEVAAEADVFRGDECVGDVPGQGVDGDGRGDAPVGAVDLDDLLAAARDDGGRIAPGLAANGAAHAQIEHENVEAERPHREKKCERERQSPSRNPCAA